MLERGCTYKGTTRRLSVTKAANLIGREFNSPAARCHVVREYVPATRFALHLVALTLQTRVPLNADRCAHEAPLDWGPLILNHSAHEALFGTHITSALQALASSRRRGAHLRTLGTPAWPVRAATSCPVAVFHTRTARSSHPASMQQCLHIKSLTACLTEEGAQHRHTRCTGRQQAALISSPPEQTYWPSGLKLAS